MGNPFGAARACYSLEGGANPSMFKPAASSEVPVLCVRLSAPESMFYKTMKSIRHAIRLAARFSFDLLTNPF